MVIIEMARRRDGCWEGWTIIELEQVEQGDRPGPWKVMVGSMDELVGLPFTPQ